jgi:hypothetical protein
MVSAIYISCSLIICFSKLKMLCYFCSDYSIYLLYMYDIRVDITLSMEIQALLDLRLRVYVSCNWLIFSFWSQGNYQVWMILGTYHFLLRITHFQRKTWKIMATPSIYQVAFYSFVPKCRSFQFCPKSNFFGFVQNYWKKLDHKDVHGGFNENNLLL